MKTKIIALLSLLALLLPLSTTAQTNVQRAFNELLKNSDVEYTESHSLNKDAETGVKESQYDVYSFTLPASKFKLIENILKAFKTDEDKAYSINEGKSDKNSQQISVAVGDGSGAGVLVNPHGYNYYYALYLAPKSEDKSGNYRYAYAMYWKKGKDKVEGTLIVTYATTLKYRQNRAYSNSGLNYIQVQTTDENWFSKMVNYIQALSNTNANSAGQQALAAKIFKQAQSSQNIKGLSEGDKDAARELLKTMISERDKYDSLTIQLLNSALANIK
ncbi:MAG: hypothetical protein K2M93_01930 [Muribaculaceae bacterium]|nr:hypothetical protein [Muribaculaceae bacterium]